jgi:hypothetical protein
MHPRAGAGWACFDGPPLGHILESKKKRRLRVVRVEHRAGVQERRQGMALRSLTYQMSPWFHYNLSKENDFPGPLVASTHPVSRKPGKHKPKCDAKLRRTATKL